MNILIEVRGIPAPQGSKSGFALKDKTGAYTGKVVMTESSEAKVKEWRAAVAAAGAERMKEQNLPPFDEPVRVLTYFWLPPSKSDPFRTRHATSPDADKLLRSTLDGLVQGGVLVDDGRVCEGQYQVRYARPPQTLPGATILVVGLAFEEEGDRARLKAAAKAARG